VFSGWVLLGAALAAVGWANADADSYRDVWESGLTLGVGDASISLDLRHWVTDALMAVFFFVVGLEIKREVIDGELRDMKTAAVPTFAAFGGMVVPAALYLAMTTGGEGARGWAIPMATDIAFAVGVLAVLGPRVPKGAKLFLLTLAIVDDIGAILVIALVYSEGLHAWWLLAAIAVAAVVAACSRAGITRPWVYLALGVPLWICVHEAGVHATIAGVVLGLLVPGKPGSEAGPLERIERALHPWSSFVIVPIFALANAGVALSTASLDRAASSAVAGGVLLGLVIGKPLGIVGATLLALRSRRARLPSGMRTIDVVGVGFVAGMGFTVSLFIANLSFGAARLDAAKLSILLASLVAATVGALVFVVAPATSTGTRRIRRPKP